MRTDISNTHPMTHNGFIPLVIVTSEPRVFRVHKSWGGLDIRPPQYFIHTMSFNQERSSAEEHMGPTDAALIPLGFCLTAGCTAPLVPWSGCCPVGHKHKSSSATPSGLLKSWVVKAATPARWNYSPGMWSDHQLWKWLNMWCDLQNKPTNTRASSPTKVFPQKSAGVLPLNQETTICFLLLNSLQLLMNIRRNYLWWKCK